MESNLLDAHQRHFPIEQRLSSNALSQLSLRNPGESSDEAYRRIYAQMYFNSKWALDVANNLDTAGFVAGSLSQMTYEARVINATLTIDTWILGNIAADKIGGDSAAALVNMAARRQAVQSATARSLRTGARIAIHAYVVQQTYDAIARLNAWSRSR